MPEFSSLFYHRAALFNQLSAIPPLSFRRIDRYYLMEASQSCPVPQPYPTSENQAIGAPEAAKGISRAVLEAFPEVKQPEPKRKWCESGSSGSAKTV